MLKSHINESQFYLRFLALLFNGLAVIRYILCDFALRKRILYLRTALALHHIRTPGYAPSLLTLLPLDLNLFLTTARIDFNLLLAPDC